MTAPRHRWQKLKAHNYLCLYCGLGKIHGTDDSGHFTTWKLPDGSTVERAPTPVCAPGPLTVERLKRCGLTQLVRT